MRIPNKITISAAATVTALLTAGGIAMATPASTGLPSLTTDNPATGMTSAELDGMNEGAGQMHGDMDAIHGDMDAMHGDMDAMHGDMDAMHGDMDAMHGDMDAMHGDAEQMRQHHARMIERDPQIQQRHDEMVDRYPEMRGHMRAFEGSPGPGR